MTSEQFEAFKAGRLLKRTEGDLETYLQLCLSMVVEKTFSLHKNRTISTRTADSVDTFHLMIGDWKIQPDGAKI